MGYEPGQLVQYKDSPTRDVGIVVWVGPATAEGYPLAILWGSDLEEDLYEPDQVTEV